MSDEEKLYRTPNRDVVVRSLDGFAAIAVVGGEHSVVLDEPPEFQGGGTAPNPFGMLLSALGACMVGTLRGVAAQHDIPYEGVEVRLSLKTNTPTLGPLDPTERRLRIAKIQADLMVQGTFTPEQRQIMREGVETCPVGNTLRRGLRLVENVRFADEEGPG